MMTAIADTQIHYQIPESHFMKFVNLFKDAWVLAFDSGMGTQSLKIVAQLGLLTE